MDYPAIPGTIPVSADLLGPDVDPKQLPAALVSPPLPTRGSKSVFAFWNSGIETLPPYLLRNVLTWYRRLSPLGWNIYVLNTVPDSALHIANYIDIKSPTVIPQALIAGGLDGAYVAQHTSDLVRFPLLLKYGGVYLDVGILQFGDFDWLWETHLSNPNSPYEYAGFTMSGPPDGITIVNFAMAAIPDCPLVLRAHKILLKLWEGRTNTVGTHKHPLVSHVPLMKVPPDLVMAQEEKGELAINDESMTDYAIQIQTLGAAQRWLDASDNWDGPKYTRENCWLYSMMEMAYVNEQMTSWNSQRQLKLFSLKMPGPGEEETSDQTLAREIVETCIAKSWCLKLAHGFSAKLFGAPTLGMLWRANPGSDCQEGTYGGWMRWAMLHLTQVHAGDPLTIPPYEPTMVARLSDYL